MSSYDCYGNEEYTKRGIDYDLCACLEYNPQEGFTVDDIDKVLAVYEGANDAYDWRWVLKLKRTIDKYVFLQGGCDYTGWDCQSSAWHVIRNTAYKASSHALDEYRSCEDFNAIWHSLNKQIRESKSETWREKKDKEFGLNAPLQT